MDKDHIAQMVQLGSTAQGVQRVQARAKEVMHDNGYGSTLHNACAATLSEFMNMSAINVPITLGAGNLARRIKGRGWNPVTVGNQRAGDVAVAVNDVHIFLVVRAVDKDIMIISDNQAPAPHRRRASGDPKLNHSPVAYFLRADGAAPLTVTVEPQIQSTPPDGQAFPQGDEDTRQLKEPFDDAGDQLK